MGTIGGECRRHHCERGKCRGSTNCPCMRTIKQLESEKDKLAGEKDYYRSARNKLREQLKNCTCNGNDSTTSSGDKNCSKCKYLGSDRDTLRHQLNLYLDPDRKHCTKGVPLYTDRSLKLGDHVTARYGGRSYTGELIRQDVPVNGEHMYVTCPEDGDRNFMRKLHTQLPPAWCISYGNGYNKLSVWIPINEKYANRIQRCRD